MKFAAHDVEHVDDVSGGAAGCDTEESGIGIRVVERDTGLDPAVLV